MAEFQVHNMDGEKEIDVRIRVDGELQHNVLAPGEAAIFQVNHPSAFSVYEVPPPVETVEDKDKKIQELEKRNVDLQAKLDATGEASV